MLSIVEKANELRKYHQNRLTSKTPGTGVGAVRIGIGTGA